MCIESLKTKTDLTLNEINILLDEEKDIKTYRDMSIISIGVY